MTKLRTLKEIDLDKTYDRGNGIVSVERIKQEAIKHIKVFGGDFTRMTSMFGGKNYSEEQLNAIVGYIKWANNITEDDLKSKENEQ